MTWVVEDNPAPAPEKRSNAKRKKGSAAADAPTTAMEVDIALDHSSKKAPVPVSKTQRKRARHNTKPGTSEEELAWTQFSLHAPLPEALAAAIAPEPNVEGDDDDEDDKKKPAATAPEGKKGDKKKKGEKQAAKKGDNKKGTSPAFKATAVPAKNPKATAGKVTKTAGKVSIANYGQIDDWGWTPVETDGMMMDDMDGFLCLEELDDVDVTFDGTEATGKTIIFKHNAQAAKAKRGKNANHDLPLPVQDNEVYFDIDTFDENVLIAQKESGEFDTEMTNGGADTVFSEGEEDSDEDMMDEEDPENDGWEDADMDSVEGDEEASEPTPTKKEKAKAVEEKKEPEPQVQLNPDGTPKLSKKERARAKLEAFNAAKALAANGGAPPAGPVILPAKAAVVATKAPTTPATPTKADTLAAKAKADAVAAKAKADALIAKADALAAKAEALAAKAATPTTSAAKVEEVKKYDPMEGVDTTFDLSAWKEFNLSTMIQNALKKLEFAKPSPIQEQALPLGLSGRDVIGVAETGSGKTIAFGLPIAEHLAKMAAEGKPEEMVALILTPTRELAIQVKEHLVAFTQFTGHHVVPIVGGMSIQKQTRQMDKNPAIIVATPGRLWELLSTNPTYSARLAEIRFLVLDEADRMLEQGHFAELSSILKILERKRERTSDWNSTVGEDGTVAAPESVARTDFEANRQTFIFTATLSKELSLNLSKKKNRTKRLDEETVEGTMEDLMERLEFHDESPAFVKVVSDKSGGAIASTLLEARIDCMTNEKDLYLYYFIKKYPGRTLVFVNSIDAIRHVVPMLQLLGIEALGMHAQMQQRQRLKSLDRFKSNPHAIMIASDVAARGLDIPLVDHVIHYQVPRSGDIYVHRSGRTARAMNEGISLLMCGPDEVPVYRKMCQKLKKDQAGIPEFPVDRGMIGEMKKRIELAKKIDEQEHRVQKSAHQDDWMIKSAEAMDIILDEDILNAGPKKTGKNKYTEDDDNSAMTGRKNKIKAMRAELKALLAKPLMPRGASAKYITSGAIRDLADRLRDNTHNPMMPATLTTTALNDIKAHVGGAKLVKKL